MQKIQLKILGISSGNVASSYTLLLEEVNGERKLPVVIGVLEAQAIAIEIEKIEPLRPMTHDLFKMFSNSFGIRVKEVVIHKIHEGIFYANLLATDGITSKEIDSRTSDAIALALRFNCPIYTYEEVINEAGLTMKSVEFKGTEAEEKLTEDFDVTEEEFDESVQELLGKEEDFSNYSVSRLRVLLKEAIKQEDYIKAAKIRDILKKIEESNESTETDSN
ncbi:MAG: bifunctional nuclease family protein [Bacteroidetes bacterium]|nr:bifunctional nuclease family protein [Bacteroidota bacterium]